MSELGPDAPRPDHPSPPDPEATEVLPSPAGHLPAADAAGPHEAELRTFLIADIRGYTTYTREHGDEAAASLASRFADLVAEVVGPRGGSLIEVRGDEALVVFVSARKALRAAIDLQARFAEAQLPRGVGIGLDAGEAIPVGDGYRGTALNLAARLCQAAGPGETLASEAVIHLAARIDGIAYVDPRSVRLKGYADAVRAVVVVPAGAARGRHPVSGEGSPRSHRLPLVAAATGIVVVTLIAGTLGIAVLGGGGSPPPGPAGPSASATASVGGSSAVRSSAAPSPLAGIDLPVLAFFDAATGDLEATTPLTRPTNVSLFVDGSFWILGENPEAFNRIDPISRRIVKSIPVPVVESLGYAVGAGAIWITDGAGPHVLRIDLPTGVVSTYQIPVDASNPGNAGDVAVGGGSVWLSRPGSGEVVRLDSATGKVQGRIPGVGAYRLAFGDGALWYTTGDRLGRIDPATNATTFEPILLAPNGQLGNVAFAGGDAWVAETSTGHVWRVNASGRQTSFALDAGVGELYATSDAVWVTNAVTGRLTGIDLVTGNPRRVIDTGHATIAVAAGNDEIMVAVGPTVDEAIADLEGSVLTIATSGTPWSDPAPDPAVNADVRVRQVLYLTCVSLLRHPDAPAPDGWTLAPEVAAGPPRISPDGRTYAFTIRPGFRFSPPSDEEVTAETFRATIERALSPVFGDDAPGPTLLGDIAGVKAYRAGLAEHVSGIVASDDQLAITLEEPAADILERLAMPVTCAVPRGTPALRSGLDPDPPVSSAGPYYLAVAGRHSPLANRLIVLKKNPNYQGDRPRPFDNIAIQTRTGTASAISDVLDGTIDAAMLDGGDPLSGATSRIATDLGPGSAAAAAGGQRWFGAPGLTMGYLALNPTRPAFRDPAVRRALSIALDRAALAEIWEVVPSADLLPPSVPGSNRSGGQVQPPDPDAARALMRGRTYTVTMTGLPTGADCGQCRAFEVALTGQLKAIGITLELRDAGAFPGGALDPGSDVDLVPMTYGTDYPDPVALIRDLRGDPWLGSSNLEELARLERLGGQARIDATAAFARRVVQEQVLIVPNGYSINPFLLSEHVGCGFVQPAIGAVDLLALCRKP